MFISLSRQPEMAVQSSSDPFQQVPEVLDTASEVFRFSLESEIGVAFVTRKAVPDTAVVRSHLDIASQGGSAVQLPNQRKLTAISP